MVEGPVKKQDEILSIEALQSGFVEYELPSLKKNKLNTAMLKAIFGNWSHVFGHPATVVGGYGEILAEELATSLAENARAGEMIDSLEESAEKMKGLIERIGTAMHALKSESYTQTPVDFETIWEIAQEKLTNKKQLSKVKCQIADPQAILQADYVMLGQAIAELINNGCQAVEEKEGGLVEVSFSIDEGETAEGRMAVISVKDNGKGIDRKLARVLSKPFFLDKGADEIREKCFLDGLGLGLGIAWLVTINHKGKVTFKTAEDVGTQVTLRIPLGENIEQ